MVADEKLLIGKGEDIKNQNQPNRLESDRPPEELKAIESMAWPQCGQKPAWPKGLAGPRRLCQMQKKAFCQIRSKFCQIYSKFSQNSAKFLMFFGKIKFQVHINATMADDNA